MNNTGVNNSIVDAIREIIIEIPEGKIFDSHFVIDQLKKDSSDMYSEFAIRNNVAPNSGAANGLIALIIGRQTDLVKKAPNTSTGDFFGANSRGNNSECTGWLKL